MATASSLPGPATAAFSPEMDELRKTIKSIAIPMSGGACGGATFRNVERDFEELEGTPIPWAKYGFPNLRAFLTSNYFKDLFFIGHNKDGLEVLNPKVDDKTAHIQQMVKEQMKPKKKGPTRKPNSFGGFHMAGFNQGARRPGPSGRSGYAQKPNPSVALKNNLTKLNNIANRNNQSHGGRQWGTGKSDWGTAPVPNRTASNVKPSWSVPKPTFNSQQPSIHRLPIALNGPSTLSSSLGEQAPVRPLQRALNDIIPSSTRPDIIPLASTTEEKQPEPEVRRDADVMTRPVPPEEYAKFFRRLEDDYLTSNDVIIEYNDTAPERMKWIAVKLTAAQSPSTLFLQLNDEEEAVEDLHQRMASFYSGSGPGSDSQYIIPKDKWCNGLLVAVADPRSKGKEQQEFRRAIVMASTLTPNTFLGHLIDVGGAVKLKENRVFYIPKSRFASGRYSKGFAFKISLLGCVPSYSKYLQSIDLLTLADGENDITNALEKKGYPSTCASLLMERFYKRSLTASFFRPSYSLETSSTSLSSVEKSGQSLTYAFLCDVTDEMDVFFTNFLTEKELVDRVTTNLIRDFLSGSISEKEVRQEMVRNATASISAMKALERTVL